MKRAHTVTIVYETHDVEDSASLWSMIDGVFVRGEINLVETIEDSNGTMIISVKENP